MHHFTTIKIATIPCRIFGLGSFYSKKVGERNRELLPASKWYLIVTVVFGSMYTLSILGNDWGDYLAEIVSDCFVFELTSAMDIYSAWATLLYALITLGTSFKKRRRLMHIHEEIYKIDQEIRRFGGEINLRRVRSRMILASLFFTLGNVLTTCFYFRMYVVVYEYPLFLLPLLLISHYSYFICPIYLTNFIICVIAIRYRFDSINDILEANYKLYLRNNEHCELLHEQDIDDLMNLYDRICDVVDEIDDCFGFILLCLFFHSFIVINAYIFILYRLLPFAISSNDDGMLVRCHFWIILILSLICQVCIVVFSIEFVSVKTVSVQKFVTKTINRCRDRVLQNKLTIFLTEISNRKLIFTACKMFQINSPLLFGMVGAIVAYFLILIQFGQADDACLKLFIDYKERHKNSTIWF